MSNRTDSFRWRQPLALAISLAMSMLLVFALGQVLVSAAEDSSQISQEDPTPVPLVRVITQTDGTTTEATLEDYLAGHTLTAAQLQELETEGVEFTLIGATSEGDDIDLDDLSDDVDPIATPSDFSGSEKTVSQGNAEPGATLNYSIVLNNTGSMEDTITVTDTLPTELTYVNGSLSISGGAPIKIVTDSNEIIWEGIVAGNSTATISFAATLSATVAVDDVITNTAKLDFGDTIIDLNAVTTIVSETKETIIYLPIIFTTLPAPDVTATRPNSANEWTLSWNNLESGVTYEVQESQDPTFANSTTTYNVSGTSYDASHPFSTDNVYYYRVRGFLNNVVGNWSDSLRVVGGYVDEFTSNQTGWDGPPQRTTFIEEVQSFYEIRDGDHWLILRVEDSWDWGVASPLQMAPEPPYVIEYRVKPANLGNLVSYGIAFGGDWDGRTCPDTSTVAGWYEHDICFNQFYNTNTIWFSDEDGLKLLFERVDNLVWCPTCMGSPMKRLGDIAGNTRNLSGVNASDWNNYRIEVRESGIRFFANGSLQYTYGDTRYVGRPYFGVFASTDEYSNSTARFEYVRVLPLDN